MRFSVTNPDFPLDYAELHVVLTDKKVFVNAVGLLMGSAENRKHGLCPDMGKERFRKLMSNRKVLLNCHYSGRVYEYMKRMEKAHPDEWASGAYHGEVIAFLLAAGVTLDVQDGDVHPRIELRPEE